MSNPRRAKAKEEDQRRRNNRLRKSGEFGDLFAALVALVAVAAVVIQSCSAQTFHYSHGWTNGKRSDPRYPPILKRMMPEQRFRELETDRGGRGEISMMNGKRSDHRYPPIHKRMMPEQRFQELEADGGGRGKISMMNGKRSNHRYPPIHKRMMPEQRFQELETDGGGRGEISMMNGKRSNHRYPPIHKRMMPEQRFQELEADGGGRGESQDVERSWVRFRPLPRPVESIPWHPYTNMLQKAASDSNGRRVRTKNFFDDYGDMAAAGGD